MMLAGRCSGKWLERGWTLSLLYYRHPAITVLVPSSSPSAKKSISRTSCAGGNFVILLS